MATDNSWSIIIPAAGKAKRMGVASKLLCMVGDMNIGQRLLSILKTQSHSISRVIAVVQSNYPPRLVSLGFTDICIQHIPNGSAYAVLTGLKHVKTRFTCVIWGDTIFQDGAVLEFGMHQIMKADGYIKVLVPIINTANPYIHLKFEGEKVVEVLEQREGQELPSPGLSDTGVFFFETETLRKKLNELIGSHNLQQGELNFLHILKLYDAVVTIDGTGIYSANTSEELEKVEAIVCK